MLYYVYKILRIVVTRNGQIPRGFCKTFWDIGVNFIYHVTDEVFAIVVCGTLYVYYYLPYTTIAKKLYLVFTTNLAWV